jgi:hypothetical protein
MLLIAGLMTISACTIHFPYEIYDDFGPIRVIFKVQPDDAKILLNGKFIGEAYEFSNNESALKLASRRNELIVKREGYVEEEVHLDHYSTNKITVRLTMNPEREYRRPTHAPKAEPIPKEDKKPESAYTPKTLQEKTPPKEPVELEKVERKVMKRIPVTIEISPAETAIYLDGKFWGISPESGKIENLRLKPGTYKIEAIKPGYKTYKKDLVIKNQEDVTIKIKLEK